jgi:hypothetical protein
MTKKWGRLPSSASFLVLLVVFGANVIRAYTLGMDHHPPKWLIEAIPAALSDLAFGNRDGYTSLKAVNDVFYTSLQGKRDGAMVDRAIREVMAVNQNAVSAQTELLGDEDKGIVDLVKISFRLFGYKTASPLHLYFVLLFLSCLIFAVTFNCAFLHSILAGFLVAHYLFLPTVFYHAQLQSVLALRFLPVLSMVACLHCLLFATRNKFTVLDLVALAFQVGLMVFVIHMRIVALWQFAVVGAITMLALARMAYPKNFRWTRGTLQLFVGGIIPIVVGLAGLAGLTAYRSVAYDQRYFREDQFVARSYWHNIFSGLAFNPELAERYQLKVDDFSVVRAVGRIATESRRAGEGKAIGGNYEDLLNSRGTAPASYDRLAAHAFLNLCLHRELKQCVATVIYYKPLSLLHHLSWLYDFRRDVPDVAIFVSPDIGNVMEVQLNSLKGSLDRMGLRFHLWDLLAIFTVISFAIILHMTEDTVRRADVIAGMVLTAGTVLPSLVGYPSMHTIAEPAIAIAAALYCSVAVFLGRGVDWQRASRLLHRMRSTAR